MLPIATNRVEYILTKSPLTAAEAVSNDGDLVQRTLVLFSQAVNGFLGRADAVHGALREQLLEAHMAHEVLPAGRMFGMGRGRVRIVFVV